MARIRFGRLMVWGVGAFAAVAIAWAVRPQPIPVDLATVGRGSLRVTLDDEGMTRVRDRYVVSAPFAGRLQRVRLNPGDTVAANRTVLATFLPATPALLDQRTREEIEARVKAAQAGREAARVALDRARAESVYTHSELDRQRQLATIGAITEERLAAGERVAQDTDARVHAAELALQTATHELDAARAALRTVTGSTDGAGASFTLRSPIDGVVLRVHQENESIVPAATPLIEIGDPRRIEVVADFLSSDAVRISPGMPVLLSGWGGDVSVCGHVRLVEPGGFTKVSALGVEEQRVNVLIDFDDLDQSTQRLGDRYRVEVTVILWEREGVLKIPTSALFRSGDRWAVFAIKDGKAVQTTVQIGQRNALDAELISGLAAGDRVVIHAGDTVEDGVAVIQRD